MEYRRKCKVCGKVYCYSDLDISDNAANSLVSGLSALGAVASLFGGTKLDTYALTAQMDRYDSKTINFNRCPNCGSLDTILLSDEEWLTIQKEGVHSFSKQVDINNNATPEALLKRAALFLEDSEWGMAGAYCDHVLDVDPESSMAYLGKLMAEFHVRNTQELQQCDTAFDTSANYQKAVRFADTETKAELQRYVSMRIYNEGVSAMSKATNESEYLAVADLFEQIKGFENADELIAQCQTEAEIVRKNAIYDSAKELLQYYNTSDYEEAIQKFESILGWRDSEEQIQNCRNKLEAMRKEDRSFRKIAYCIGAVLLVVLVLSAIWFFYNS